MLTPSNNKEKRIKKKYLRRTRKLLETKLNIRNHIKMINTWVVPPCNIFGTILGVDQRKTFTN